MTSHHTLTGINSQHQQSACASGWRSFNGQLCEPTLHILLLPVAPYMGHMEQFVIHAAVTLVPHFSPWHAWITAILLAGLPKFWMHKRFSPFLTAAQVVASNPKYLCTSKYICKKCYIDSCCQWLSLKIIILVHASRQRILCSSFQSEGLAIIALCSLWRYADATLSPY